MTETTEENRLRPYHVRRDIYGFAEAIERDSYTVLILATGATRNEEEVDCIVETLNLASRQNA